jgi:hypothetical protein
MKAFPSSNTVPGYVDLKESGMDLRDYFAAKALQSLMQNFLAKELDEVDPTGWMAGLATDSYTMADAMMEARNVK